MNVTDLSAICIHSERRRFWPLLVVAIVTIAVCQIGSTPASVEAQENTKVSPQDGLVYVSIPSGTFIMGCSAGDNDCGADESPPHQVTIAKGFWMSQTEVTVAAYRRFVGGTGAQLPEAPNFNAGWHDEVMPIMNVSWNDASAFCGWAGGRLPTEAEWEYAARAGSAQSRYGPIDEVAWYLKNSSLKTHEVGQKHANAFGLYDMLGNAWEWVNDWYGETYYGVSPERDPQGPDAGEVRVLRGGSWVNDGKYLRVSNRSGGDPTDKFSGNGFRCARDAFAP
ncbi:MAG: formylglycine-generating enzyme family protein [Terriglobia bacterium]